MTTSASSLMSLVAALEARSFLHWSSSASSWIFMPSTPPLAFTFSDTILAAFRVGMP